MRVTHLGSVSPHGCSTIAELASIHDFHVRMIPRYVADYLACFAVRLADWPEEMAPKRRFSEKQPQTLAANRLKRHAKVCNLYVGVRVSGGELRSISRLLSTLHAMHAFVSHISAMNTDGPPIV